MFTMTLVNSQCRNLVQNNIRRVTMLMLNRNISIQIIKMTTKMSIKDLLSVTTIYLKNNRRGYLDQEFKAVLILMIICQDSSNLYHLRNHLLLIKINEMDSYYNKAARVSRILRRVQDMMGNSYLRRKQFKIIIRIPRETMKKKL